ncbi:MAG TPA: HAD family hydrolase [Candidatus Limnocylindria bacterium]|nr:HAD family hydrolase [Candidatus Limnocylindria bacterium]
MTRPRAVLWDLDGTLTDSVRFVVDTANTVIARHGGAALEFDRVGRMTGLPLEAIFRLAWPDLSDADAITYRDEYRRIYDEVAIPATKLFRGARATLHAFRRADILQATVTGKRAADCERILRGLGIKKEVDAYLGGDSVRHAKPAPDLALAAAERLGTRPADCVVIGDSRVDMAMGRAAGMRTLQVLWGYEKERVGEADDAVRTWPALRARILGGDGPVRP